MIGYVDGINEIRAKVWNAWLDGSAAIAGYVPEMRFADVGLPSTPDKSKFWARLSVVDLTDQQATLSTAHNIPGKRRYRANGQVVLQVFGPVNVDQSDYVMGKLCELVQNTLRGGKTPGGIWFRNVGIRPLPSEDLFYRRNVVCEFERDDIA